MENESGNRVRDVSGEVGEIYTGPDNEYAVPEDGEDENAYREYTTGWMQISKTERIRVRYTRISHTMCVWKKVLE